MSAVLNVVRLRPAKPSDVKFIFDSWVESYRKCPFAEMIPGPVYYRKHGAKVKATLSRAFATVACSHDDEDQIAGYVVFEPPKLHYVYVKEEMRKYGIASELLRSIKQPVSIHTHETTSKGVRPLRAIQKTVFDPYEF